MTTTIDVKRLATTSSRCLYAYGRDGNRDGYFVVDTHLRLIFPSDAAGAPTSEMRLLIDESELTTPELDDETREAFIDAVTVVVLKMQAGEDPPETANRTLET